MLHLLCAIRYDWYWCNVFLPISLLKRERSDFIFVDIKKNRRLTCKNVFFLCEMTLILRNWKFYIFKTKYVIFLARDYFTNLLSIVSRYSSFQWKRKLIHSCKLFVCGVVFWAFYIQFQYLLNTSKILHFSKPDVPHTLF